MTLPPFQRLLDAHAGDVLRFLVGAVGRDDAEDAFQETLLSALRAYPGLEHADNLRAWLFTIAHRRVVDERRRAGRRRDAALPAAPPSPGADTAFDEHDSLARAIALVAQLADPMREAVLLRIVADLSVDDTALVMGLRPGHVRVLVHRGLRRLEQLLGAQRHAVTDGDAPTMERST